MKDHPDIVVVGQIARDLVLVVDEMPDTGTSAAVRQRREMLGGKGANQAVGLAQLGVQVAVLGVVGADDTGEWLLAQAEKDGIDVDRVLRRGESGLILDVVDGEGRWRYLEDLPKSALLSEEDVRAAKDLLGSARYVVVQLQQPADAVLAALRCAKEAGGRVVVDGVPDRASLSMVDVLRADAREAELLMDRRIRSSRDALRAGRELLRDGPGSWHSPYRMRATRSCGTPVSCSFRSRMPMSRTPPVRATRSSRP
jgi:ribokinase